MPSLDKIHAQQSAYQDAMVRAFEEHLRAIVTASQASVTAKLQHDLVIEDGIIQQTPGNLKLIRNLNNLLVKEMKKRGLKTLLNAYAGEFPQQLQFFDQTLEYLSEQMDTPLPKIKFTGADISVMSSFQANAVSSLETAMETAAAAVMTRGMLSVGGLRFGELVETLGKRLDVGIAQARTIADTGMSVFYRTATDRGYRAIEASFGKTVVKYKYSGPNDVLTRPFCVHLLAVDKAYTREQIDKMSNGQLPNVFISGGGWNCRHNFLLDVSELEVMAAEAA
jgi:hypothetical protein